MDEDFYKWQKEQRLSKQEVIDKFNFYIERLESLSAQPCFWKAELLKYILNEKILKVWDVNTNHLYKDTFYDNVRFFIYQLLPFKFHDWFLNRRLISITCDEKFAEIMKPFCDNIIIGNENYYDFSTPNQKITRFKQFDANEGEFVKIPKSDYDNPELDDGEQIVEDNEEKKPKKKSNLEAKQLYQLTEHVHEIMKIYKKISRSYFEYENSAYKDNLAYYHISKFKIVGWNYGDDIPYRPKENSIVVMFEKENFEQVWFHYDLYKE